MSKTPPKHFLESLKSLDESICLTELYKGLISIPFVHAAFKIFEVDKKRDNKTILSRRNCKKERAATIKS